MPVGWARKSDVEKSLRERTESRRMPPREVQRQRIWQNQTGERTTKVHCRVKSEIFCRCNGNAATLAIAKRGTTFHIPQIALRSFHLLESNRVAASVYGIGTRQSNFEENQH